MNIVQQIGGSIGAAVMSVILTSELNESTPIPGAVDPRSGEPITEAELAIAVRQNPELTQQFPVDPSIIERGLNFAADSFATTFWVGFALVLATFIPTAFLPRRREVSHLLDDELDAAAAARLPVH